MTQPICSNYRQPLAMIPSAQDPCRITPLALSILAAFGASFLLPWQISMPLALTLPLLFLVCDQSGEWVRREPFYVSRPPAPLLMAPPLPRYVETYPTMPLRAPVGPPQGPCFMPLPPRAPVGVQQRAPIQRPTPLRPLLVGARQAYTLPPQARGGIRNEIRAPVGRR